MAKWGILWREESRLDGKVEHLLGRFSSIDNVPPHVAGYTTMVFDSRQAARNYLRTCYGYISTRIDLRREPLGWKMPKVVKVAVSVQRERCR